MKRSKMIQLLTDRIILSHVFLKHDPKKAGKIMLEAIEKAGMLPPLVKQDFLDSDNQDYAFMSEWEPEDE